MDSVKKNETIETVTNGVEATALLVAAMKTRGSQPALWKALGLNSTRTEPLFDTQLLSLFNQYAQPVVEAAEAAEMYDSFPLLPAIRHKYINDLVAYLNHFHISQVISLGAGFDTRAAERLANADVKFFEVDSAKVLDLKQRVFARNGINANAVYIRDDYMEHNFMEELIKSGADLHANTLFIWEGNSVYLDKAETDKFWNRIEQAFDAYYVVFDAVSERGLQTLLAREKMKLFCRQLGISFVSAYDDVDDFCRVNRLELLEAFTMEELAQKYGIHDGSLPTLAEFKMFFLKKH